MVGVAAVRFLVLLLVLLFHDRRPFGKSSLGEPDDRSDDDDDRSGDDEDDDDDDGRVDLLVFEP